MAGINTLPQFIAQVQERVKRATPGPWFVAEQPFDDRSTAVYGDNKAQVACDPHGARFVVDCDVTMEWTEGDPDQSVFDRANAQLIAHAPTDLTKALQVIEVLMQAIQHDTGRTINADNAMEMYWRDSVVRADALKAANAIVAGGENG